MVDEGQGYAIGANRQVGRNGGGDPTITVVAGAKTWRDTDWR